MHPAWRLKTDNPFVYPNVSNRKQDKGPHQHWG